MKFPSDDDIPLFRRLKNMKQENKERVVLGLLWLDAFFGTLLVCKIIHLGQIPFLS